MNRFGYIAETIRPQPRFNSEMYNHFGYIPQNHFGYENDLSHHFGNMSMYGPSDEEETSEEETSDEDEHSFGKKMTKVQSQAKKAMQIAHSRGISLKKAWAIVKKGGGGGTRSTRKKPATRRSSRGRNEAKRAMKLKHQRGISLKKAWAIVKKERRR